MEEFMLPCLNKKLFGLECYGCGAQRSLALLLKGNFAEAFHMYPAIYSLILLLAFLVFNLFFKFKNDYSVKIGLIVLNAGIVLGSYLFKFFLIIN